MKILRLSFTFVLVLSLASLLCTAQTTAEQTAEKTKRSHYAIQIKLDFDSRAYSGSEVVRWVNREDHSISAVYFHLYSNLRPAETPPTQAKSTAIEDEEPRIDVTEVLGSDRAPLNYS
ncbi:MAG TPA: hypothetical protein VJT50_17175, partial [Pyrinomonadaceae bacterium]|nr:hypothetical protein [Pyrinomonadaceae bacterium]